MNISSINSNYYYSTAQTNTAYRFRTANQSTATSSAAKVASVSTSSSSSTQINPQDLFEMFQAQSNLKRSELNTNSTESAETMEAVKSLVDEIKNLDLSTLSEEEVTDVLTGFQEVLASVSNAPTAATTLKNADLSTMSSADQSALLEDIQTEAITLDKAMMGGRRPNGPPPGGKPPGKTDETDSVSSITSTTEDEQTAMEKLLEELLEKLEETTLENLNEESTTESEPLYTKSQFIDFLKEFSLTNQQTT